MNTGISEIIKQLTDFGFQAVFTGGVFRFIYKWINLKFFTKQKAEVYREYNNEKDNEENKESKERLKKLQLYLEENSDYFFNLGIDRVSVWLNHNGMRNGKIHFIFYSLVAEISKSGLSRFVENAVGNQRLPYYVFADYEDSLMKNKGCYFMQDAQNQLKGSAKSIANDLGTKSLLVAPICNIDGTIDGIIFFSATFKQLEEKPDCQQAIDNIRILFIN